ncbi:hypothetical protein [Allorhodopirellula heiligendammensis]|uniref:FlgN protein n=1 Tax=Allorhodopirellula heiligendammensis TaxID=2714739 RepID=A0A5C6C5U0_9BACT|nr:hypothetical protein [Allorhodopirellula heiligendammensis]TWU18149.1 hypothetical protein Poly21_03040 [Allorhodopirellula heiligendammensis]
MNAGSSVDQPNTVAWRERVASYLLEATDIANSIDLILDETRMGAPNLGGDDAESTVPHLATAVAELERIVEKRDVLLRASDAPPFGLSLSAKLLSTRKIDDARLAKCCGELADLVAQTHQRATALFICQHYLSGLPSDLIARLSAVGQPQSHSGRFNEAA